MVTMRLVAPFAFLWSFFGLQFMCLHGYDLFINDQGLTDLPDFPAEVTKVIVNGNYLKNIARDAFDNITTLYALEANSNQIREFPDLGIQKINIVRIELSHNQISYIEKEKLDGLISIQAIHVLFNKLYQCPDVSSITTLKHLGISGNRIQRVYGHFLPVHNTELLALYVNDNPVDLETCLQDIKPISGILKRIQMVKAGSSPTYLCKEKLEAFDQLLFIEIGKNNFKRLPDFHHQIHTLKTVSIIESQIKSMNYYDLEPFFYNTSDNMKRDAFDLSDNKLKTFPCVKTLKKTLNTLKLQGNPLHCDCRLHDLLQEVKNSGNTFPEVDATPCMSPPSLIGVNWNDIPLDNLSCKGDNSSPSQSREFKKVKVDYKKTGPYLDTQVTESALRCMRVCVKNKDCWSLNFDKKTGQCELIRHSECDFGTALGWEIYDSQ